MEPRQLPHKMAPLLFLLLVAVPIGLALTGFTIGQPFRGPGFDRQLGVTAEGAGETVVVALTHVVMNNDRAQRKAFKEHLWRVVDDLPSHDGLIGFSVRKQLFGKQAWTLSAWVDEESMRRFVDSNTHRQAIAGGMGALETVRFARIKVSKDALPMPWSEALDVLDVQNAEDASR